MKNKVIDSIREFNRFYTTILGVINNHILESPYSITEARIIYELANSDRLTARALKERLGIDEGYMSRIIKRFIKDSLIDRKQSGNDKRAYILTLTPLGKNKYNMINEQSNKQVHELINHLNSTEQEKLAALIIEVKKLLSKK